MEEYRNIVIQFQTSGVPGFDGTAVTAGEMPYYDLRQTWTGDYVIQEIFCVLIILDGKIGQEFV